MLSINEVLTPQEIVEFKKQGYTEQQIQLEINKLDTNYSSLKQSYNSTINTNQQDPRRMASQSMFGAEPQDNLIKWQLELNSILERVEHMLRGDKIKFEQGHIIWIPATEEKEKILNDFGVAEVMRVLSMYLNRNTILSNYDEPTINWKVFDFGFEITDLFYLKYESMGLNDLEKRKLYPILVRELVDIVHSAYLRALHGGERESLRESRTVAQTQQIPGINIQTGMPSQRERSVLNPLRYLQGRYK